MYVCESLGVRVTLCVTVCAKICLKLCVKINVKVRTYSMCKINMNVCAKMLFESTHKSVLNCVPVEICETLLVCVKVCVSPLNKTHCVVPLYL